MLFAIFLFIRNNAKKNSQKNAPILVYQFIIARVGHKCGQRAGSQYVSAECFRYSGEGDELISPVYNAPTLPPYKVNIIIIVLITCRISLPPYRVGRQPL